jgi:hypothetical protein
VRDYGKVRTAIWSDEKVREDMTSDDRVLLLYLLTSPHTTALGAFYCPDGYILEDLRWTPDRVKAAKDSLARLTVALFDRTGWVWLVNFLKHNVPENGAVWKHVRKLGAAVPERVSFRSRVIASIPDSENKTPSPHGVPNGTDENKPGLPEPSPEPSLSQNRTEPEPNPTEPRGSAANAAPAPLPEIPPSLDRREPFETAVDSWNAMADELGLAQVERRTSQRKSSWKARFANGHAADWPRALDAIRSSRFCRGDNDRGWRVDFDFLLAPAKLTKLLEGKYADRDGVPKDSTGIDWTALKAKDQTDASE